MMGVNIGVPVPREPFSFGGMNMSNFGHSSATVFDRFTFGHKRFEHISLVLNRNFLIAHTAILY